MNRTSHVSLSVGSHGKFATLVSAGLAKLGGLCSYLSVSIVEQDNTASVGATAAHELGHRSVG